MPQRTFLSMNCSTEVKKSLRRKKCTNKELLWRGPEGWPRDPQRLACTPWGAPPAPPRPRPERELHLLTHF